MDAGGRLLRENLRLAHRDGVPIEQVVYPSVHHSFYYPEFQPGRTMFGHRLEYNEEAATDATRRMRDFLNRHLN